MNSTKITTVKDLQPNGMYIVYSDAYYMNESYKIIFTNADNQPHDCNAMKWPLEDYDRDCNRGLISAWRLSTSYEADTQYEIFAQFRNLCRNYVAASNELKQYKPDQSIFENSKWYRFAAKRSKAETIERNRKAFYDKITAANAKIHGELIGAKVSLKTKIESLGFSCRVAYFSDFK